MFDPDPILQAQRNWQAAIADGAPGLQKFASHALERCAQAVAILAENLNAVGYRWASVERVPEDRLAFNIARIEKSIGSPVPEILAEFWKQVGGVAFVDLENYQHVRFWNEYQLAGPDGYCDGLYVEDCTEAWADYVCDDFKDWQEFRTPGKPEYVLSLSPDGYHKDNISGGAPYGLSPGEGWTPVWQYYDWPGPQRPICAGGGPPDFLTYLRAAILECAGFPAFLGLPAFNPLREKLLRGVPVF